MEYSELKNRLFNPFYDLINDIEAQQKRIPVFDENSKQIYPDGYYYQAIRKFNNSRLSLLDAQILIREFLKGQDPDIKQRIESDIQEQILYIMTRLHEIPLSIELAKLLPKQHKYLNSLKADIQTNTLEREKPIKDFKLKPGIDNGKVKSHYDWLYSNNYTDSPEKDFKAIFSNDPLPDNWQPVRWIKLSEKGKTIGRPNITALAATIFELLDVKKSEKFAENLSYFFVDKDGNTIKPNLKVSPDPDTLGQYLP